MANQIVVCENCGKKYALNSEQLQRVKGKRTKITCRNCGFELSLAAPGEETAEGKKRKKAGPSSGSPAPDEEREEKHPKTSLPKAAGLKIKGPGLRTKMFLVLLVVPMVLMLVLGIFYQSQLNKLSSENTSKTISLIRSVAERDIGNIANAVAMQAETYLFTRPGLTRQYFDKAIEFKKIVMQRVGVTGFTALYARPDRYNIWRYWVHPNPDLIGANIEKAIKPGLGSFFPRTWKIISGVKDGSLSRGYYKWEDKDGVIREKYMVNVPIKDTPFVISCTAPIDEFIKPIRHMEERADKLSARVRNINIAILGATLIFIAFIVGSFGHRLSKNVRHLTEVADRISMGGLDSEIEITSKDEIGNLAGAISRMQDSLRFSLERLKRKR